MRGNDPKNRRPKVASSPTTSRSIPVRMATQSPPIPCRSFESAGPIEGAALEGAALEGVEPASIRAEVIVVAEWSP